MEEEGYTNPQANVLLWSHVQLDAQQLAVATSSTHLSLVLARTSFMNAVSLDLWHQDKEQYSLSMVQSMSHQSIAQATSVHNAQPSTAFLAKELIQKQWHARYLIHTLRIIMQQHSIAYISPRSQLKSLSTQTSSTTQTRVRSSTQQWMRTSRIAWLSATTRMWW